MIPEIKKVLGKKSFLFHYLPALIVLIVFLMATSWAFMAANNSFDIEKRRVIERLTHRTEESIIKRIDSYEEILRGGAGLFTVSDEVTRADWEAFINLYDIDERYPGIQGVGYSLVITPEEVEAVVEMSRLDGFPEYSLYPEGLRDSYTPIRYIEPMNDRNKRALGYDMFSEPTRKKAMEQARDSGEMYFTDIVKLRQETEKSASQPGFIAYLPVYQRDQPTDTIDQRRTALVGYVYAPFRSNDLFNGIFSESNPELGFRIYSSTQDADQLLFATANYDQLQQSKGSMPHSTIMPLNGVVWKINYIFNQNVVASSYQNRPGAIFVGGLLLSILTAGLVLTLLIFRTRTLASQKEHEIQAAKDDLLSLASHQLRTPATGVKQYVAMVLEGYAGSLKNEQRLYLEKAYESNERQLRIINDLLYVAKADAGRIVLAKRNLRLNDLVKDIVSEHRHLAKEKNISLRMKLPSRDRVVHADKHCLRMAIENLLSNALKYTPDQGKVSVTVTYRKSEAVISIKDSGVGIKPEDQKLLFTRFTRIPNDLTSQVPGSGIGLYLAAKLVQLHDGEIKVVSEEFIGTTFTIHLPYRT